MGEHNILWIKYSGMKRIGEKQCSRCRNDKKILIRKKSIPYIFIPKFRRRYIVDVGLYLILKLGK